MKLNEADKALLEKIGQSKEIGRDLEEFGRNARFLSSQMATLLRRYRRRWVAVYQGKVIVDGMTLSSVLSKIDEKGISRQKVAVRFIDRHGPALIV